MIRLTHPSYVLLGLLCLVFGSFSLAAETGEVAVEMESAAAAERLTASLQFLAGDDLQGRGVGTEGIDAAADYLAGQFRAMGLRTDWYGGSPFQEFEITDRTELGPAEHNWLQFVRETGEGQVEPQPAAEDNGQQDNGQDDADQPDAESQVGEDGLIELQLESTFTPLAIGKSGSIDHPLAFVGYGITAEQLDYDDYGGIDVKDKVVIMLRHEPQQGDEQSPFEGTRSSSHATFRRKIGNAATHGAAAVIIVNDKFSLESNQDRQRERLQLNAGRLAERHAEFQQLENPTVAQREEYTKRIDELAKRIVESGESLGPDAQDKLVGFDHGGSSPLGQFPVFFASRAAVEPMIQAAMGKSLAEIEQEIDATGTPSSQLLEGWRAQGQSDIVSTKVTIKNVVAVLEGEGPLADETIVIGAHYDHLGMGGGGSFAPWTLEIHNGADDNASGTAALLEVAHRLASRDQKPRRRIVLIAFTGEERGLLGSKHYVRNPRFPMDNVVAMINMDMVGRLHDNELTVYGTGTASSFDELIDSLNEEHAFKLNKIPSGYGPSDHASFYEAEVPVLFLFTGLHKDYHRPSDDWDKINVEGMQRVIDMVVDVVDAIDADDDRPTYVKTQREQRRGNRVYLGIMPDMAAGADGVLVGELTPGGPAETAGMREGDLIVRIGETEIEGSSSLGEALRAHKPEEKVKVIVIRDGHRQTLEVTLGSR